MARRSLRIGAAAVGAYCACSYAFVASGAAGAGDLPWAAARQSGGAGSRGRRRVVVVGAGVVGCAAAYELARAGHTVVVVEGDEGAARATSALNGGVPVVALCFVCA